MAYLYDPHTGALRYVRPPSRRLRLSLPRWSHRATAIVLSLALETLTIGMLIALGDIPAPPIPWRERTMVLDLVSPAESEAGAAAQQSATVVVPVSTDAKVDIAAKSELPSDQTAAKLPSIKHTGDAVPTAIMAGAGDTNAGLANGEGYDPYAYAAYQPELVARAISGAALTPDPDALALVEQAVQAGLHARGITITLMVIVTPDGHVTQAGITSPLDQPDRAIVQRIVLDNPLFTADEARTNDVQTMVTLHI